VKVLAIVTVSEHTEIQDRSVSASMW